MATSPKFDAGATRRPLVHSRMWLGGGIAIGLAMVAAIPTAAQTTTPPTSSIQRQLDVLARVLAIVRDRHVSRPAVDQLGDAALRGLIQGVDPDAEILEPGARPELDPGAPLEITGMIVRREMPVRRRGSGGLRVLSTANGSSAARAGLQSDDIITHIDDEAVAGRPFAEILGLTRPLNRASHAVRITARRGDPGDTRDYLLSHDPGRGPIVLEARDDGILIVRFQHIDATTGAALAAAVGAAIRESRRQVTGLALDLRNVASGRAMDAVDIADAFLDAGPILVGQSRRDARTNMIMATPGDAAQGVPMAVLVDGGTGMAAEIAAAALRGNGRALLVGSKTSGRAFSRSSYRIGTADDPVRSVLIPTLRFLAPDGTPIHGAGLKPDIEATAGTKDASCRATDVLDEGEFGCRPRGDGEDGQVLAAIAALRQHATTRSR